MICGDRPHDLRGQAPHPWYYFARVLVAISMEPFKTATSAMPPPDSPSTTAIPTLYKRCAIVERSVPNTCKTILYCHARKRCAIAECIIVDACDPIWYYKIRDKRIIEVEIIGIVKRIGT